MHHRNSRLDIISGAGRHTHTVCSFLVAVTTTASLQALDEEEQQLVDEPVVSSDPVHDLQPSKPKDFVIFINLVEFSRCLIVMYS